MKSESIRLGLVHSTVMRRGAVPHGETVGVGQPPPAQGCAGGGTGFWWHDSAMALSPGSGPAQGSRRRAAVELAAWMC